MGFQELGSVVVIDYSKLTDALSQLEISLKLIDSEDAKKKPVYREKFRTAAIQEFEYTYDLAVKLIRRQLAEIVPNPSELTQMSFMDLIRSGAQAGLVQEVENYRSFREIRNTTSHTYDETKAQEVMDTMEEFLPEIKFLIQKLGAFHDGQD